MVYRRIKGRVRLRQGEDGGESEIGVGSGDADMGVGG